MACLPLPEMVGYWGTADPGSPYPHPSELVAPGGLGDLKERVVRYLLSGREFIGWLGHSYCRFDCGIADDEMGDWDLSDGTWVWPQGLAHYVACHDIILPQEFLDTMRISHWTVPPLSEIPIPQGDHSMRANAWVQWTKELRASANSGRSILQPATAAFP